MATHCSVLAWRIPWTEEPGGLQSMRSQKGHKCLSTHSAQIYKTESRPLLQGVAWTLFQATSRLQHLKAYLEIKPILNQLEETGETQGGVHGNAQSLSAAEINHSEQI